ncbi:MAG: hypothetical protein P8Y17_02875 [Patescibacteria group bacterium]
METQKPTPQPQPAQQPAPQPVAKPVTQPIKQQVMKKFPKGVSKKTMSYVLASFLIVLLGVGTGWFLSGSAKSGSKSPTSGAAPGAETGAKEAGIADESTFRDTAEGVLEEGGVDGEGTHHLVREGGPSKYVYLTSTANSWLVDGRWKNKSSRIKTPLPLIVNIFFCHD